MRSHNTTMKRPHYWAAPGYKTRKKERVQWYRHTAKKPSLGGEVRQSLEMEKYEEDLVDW